MNSTKLLVHLRAEAARLAPEIPLPPNEKSPAEFQPGTPEYINATMAAYNYATFLEISDESIAMEARALDERLVEKFTIHLDAYMDEFAPGQSVFKRYIRMISLYLTFIARRPLHPPGMEMAGIERYAIGNGSFFCAGEKGVETTHSALCRFCVAHFATPSW